MELSDDEDDSNYCTPETSRMIERTNSNPIPGNDVKSHLNTSGMRSRLKSPSAGHVDLGSSETSCDQEGVEPLSMATDVEKARDVPNGGTVLLQYIAVLVYMYMYVELVESKYQ